MATSSKPAHLNPSQLGTKEYWDRLYTAELTNHAADPSDTGTNWFDDSDAQSRIVSFLESLADDGQDLVPQPQPLWRSEASVLDLGCGNGSLLFALRDEGWGGKMLGVDYSAKSVALAKQIGAAREEAGEEEEEEERDEDDDSVIATAAATASASASAVSSSVSVDFLEWDLLAGPLTPPTSPSSPLSYTSAPSALFDIILDKGTFDAISLATPESSPTSQTAHPCEAYRRRLLQLLNPHGGIFLVTSCNWTEAELRSWFEDDADGQLRVVGRIEYPTFTFGGVKGQTISTLCFGRGVKGP
ncbi:S-adenosyl-L-methionine-dependent methyltransferase [Trichoderma ceciliae]